LLHDTDVARLRGMREHLDGLFAVGSSGRKSANAANTAWNLYSASKSRLVGGVFTSTPDYVVVVHGTNDEAIAVADGTVTTQAQAWLSAARTAAPSAKIFLVTPVGGYKRAALAAVTLPDSSCYLIDLGTEMQAGLTPLSGAAASRRSADGIHPNGAGHMEAAARLSQAIMNKLQPYSTSGGGGGGGRGGRGRFGF